ncbi:hypothetical protein BdWA1_000012 [Babesia duncani]|uniref:Uncharacterized protein n=1 Tax=Babesia duncani TaxID=323732 RepID=A0AAD9UPF5_9APIC|nr:hypothetical protein BdWA1_000012 [Babesia duncani]
MPRAWPPTKPRTNAQKKLYYKRLDNPKWPPPNASPAHPIEPWGKQFFVLNAMQGQELETLLCVADYQKKPLMFLRREDLDALQGCMPAIKHELQRLQDQWTSTESRFDLSRLELAHDIRATQRIKTGRHSSHTIMRGRGRPKVD